MARSTQKADQQEGRQQPQRSQRQADTQKGDGPDRAPSEVFDGPAHALNLGQNQSAFVNDKKKRELEEAFGDRYSFTEIKHHGVLQPIEGDHQVAWEVRNAADTEDDDSSSGEGEDDVRSSASDDQQLSDQPEEGLKS